MISQTDPGAAAPSQDFTKLVELQQQHSETTLALEKLESKMSSDALKAATSSATEYVVLQESLSQFDAGIKELFTRHPEWREEGRKSVKTPYGSVEQRSATELDVPNPAATVALIKARAKEDTKFEAATFLHVEESPNLEALEALGNDELDKLGVTRTTKEKITVKPAKIAASKVVKAASVKETK
jgi:5-enolpyruvylshikimate-3-phosphate synthase